MESQERRKKSVHLTLRTFDFPFESEILSGVSTRLGYEPFLNLPPRPPTHHPLFALPKLDCSSESISEKSSLSCSLYKDRGPLSEKWL